MANITEMMDALIGREGGYVNHPNDKGGETIWGITVAVARAFGYHGAMRDMPRAVAVNIYLSRYYEQPRFHLVAEHSKRIAEELFDTGVNMGTATAGKFLQRALNTLNQQGKIYPDIAVDGAIGNMTIAALRAYLGYRVAGGEAVLMRLLNAQQAVRYMEIVEKTPSQESFMHGWVMHRVEM